MANTKDARKRTTKEGYEGDRDGRRVVAYIKKGKEGSLDVKTGKKVDPKSKHTTYESSEETGKKMATWISHKILKDASKNKAKKKK